MKKLFLLSIFSLYVLCGYAQENSFISGLFKRVPYDTHYVESFYDDFLHLTLVGNLQSQNVEVSNSASNIGVSYMPNNAFRFGLGLDYRFLALEYTRSIGYIDAPDSNQGETKSTSFKFGITGRRFLGSMLLQRYQGMYISNAEQLADAGAIVEDQVRPDILSELVFGSLNYFFNHRKYSAMASLWQIDRQKQSAGSFALGIMAMANHLKADRPLVPDTIAVRRDPEDRLVENYNYVVGINTGYAHNFTWMKLFFFNVMLIPGINLQYGNSVSVSGVRNYYKSQVGYHGDVRVVAGYNGDRYYGGVHYSNYFTSNSLASDVRVNLYNTYLRVFIGRRFNLVTRKRH